MRAGIVGISEHEGRYLQLSDQAGFSSGPEAYSDATDGKVNPLPALATMHTAI